MESVALTYAKALFSLALEENNSDVILDQIKEVKDIALENDDLLKILDSKSIDKETKKQILVKIFDGRIDKSLLNFMKLLVDKSRIHNLISICTEYRKIYLEHNGIKEAKVYSAHELTSTKLNEVKEALEVKYQTKFVVENFIDEKLVAGIKVVIGDLVIDGSISNKLDRMKSSISI
ncbi:F-type H+-transporting ATPase subunit delta [Bacilli bacterium PM5-3]|nr:F-type H+-transporting ATPase subunit delta [Bacilli bacterium PM5-3]MDH6603988.1 F-type H+-transporting ATPase subunit delta [Bacilli bacterium PM5-9]